MPLYIPKLSHALLRKELAWPSKLWDLRRSRPSHAVHTSRLLVLLPYCPIDCPLSCTKSAALGKEDKWPRVCPDLSPPPSIAGTRSCRTGFWVSAEHTQQGKARAVNLHSNWGGRGTFTHAVPADAAHFTSTWCICTSSPPSLRKLLFCAGIASCPFPPWEWIYLFIYF